MASRSLARPIGCSDPVAAPHGGICVASHGSTIVSLRDGRRSRPWHADVAQLVAHHLAKVRVAGSNPVIRSKVQEASTPAVEWPSGEATACKAVHTGSIPVSTSKNDPARLAQRESASLTRKRSLVQSQYRAPVSLQVRPGFYWGLSCLRAITAHRPGGMRHPLRTSEMTQTTTSPSTGATPPEDLAQGMTPPLGATANDDCRAFDDRRDRIDLTYVLHVVRPVTSLRWRAEPPA